MKHTFTEYTERCLRNAGWYPERFVPILNYLAAIKADGYDVSSAAQKFLREFGGLKITHKHIKTDSTDLIQVEPALAVSKIFRERVNSYSEICSHKLVPVGMACRNHIVLCVSDDGAVFGGFDAFFGLYGKSPDEAFNNLCDVGGFVKLAG